MLVLPISAVDYQRRVSNARTIDHVVERIGTVEALPSVEIKAITLRASSQTIAELVVLSGRTSSVVETITHI